MANTYVAMITQAYLDTITALEFAKYKTNLDKLFAHKIKGTAISGLEDAVDFNASISCKAYSNANIVIPDITWTNLTFNVEAWDTDAMHTTGGSNQNFTVPKAGKYLVRCEVYWAAHATGLRQIRVTQQGTQMGETADLPGQATAFSQAYSDVLNCAASDVLVFQVWQNTGGNLNVTQVGAYGISASVTFLGV